MPLKPHPTDPDKMVYVKAQYALPKPWQGLTDSEIDDLSREMVKGNKSVNWLAYSIESRLKELNS